MSDYRKELLEKFNLGEEINLTGNDWYVISVSAKLSEEFIREFQNELDWKYICTHQVLSEKFILEFESKLDWTDLSDHQILSEDFIRRNKDKLDWNSLIRFQNLSDSFLIENSKTINWNDYFFNKEDISYKILKKFIGKVDFSQKDKSYYFEINLYYLNVEQRKEIQKLIELKDLFKF
jgi:hypothetical protein